MATLFTKALTIELTLPHLESFFSQINNLRQWVTNEFKHSGIRDDGGRIFDRLLNICRDQIVQD